MLSAEVGAPVGRYVRSLEQAFPGRVAAVYLVGSPALYDFSPRQSNIDLVVVVEDLPEGDERRVWRRAEAGLERASRPGAVWYTTWQTIAEGSIEGAGSALDTPLTRELLRTDAIAIVGPDWPVVAYDQSVFRVWCSARLDEVATQAGGLMVMRREVTTVVLEAARLAHGALTGRVMSKSEAGEAARRLVPPHFRRILTDAVGYRQGATTSMYWGPFERKYDARELIRNLVAAVAKG